MRKMLKPQEPLGIGDFHDVENFLGEFREEYYDQHYLNDSLQ